MQKFYLLFIIISSVCFIACSDKGSDLPKLNDLECENDPVDLGTIHLDTLTRSFLPYMGDENLIFKNANGDEITFASNDPLFTHIDVTIQFELQCMTGDTNVYDVRREQYFISKTCDTLGLQFSLNVYPQNSHEFPEFYDELSLLLYDPPLTFFLDSAINLGFITSIRGATHINDPSFLYPRYKYTTDTTLLNEEFLDVYYSSKTSGHPISALFFTPTQGMVAFRDQHEILWVLDRIE